MPDEVAVAGAETVVNPEAVGAVAELEAKIEVAQEKAEAEKHEGREGFKAANLDPAVHKIGAQVADAEAERGRVAVIVEVARKAALAASGSRNVVAAVVGSGRVQAVVFYDEVSDGMVGQKGRADLAVKALGEVLAN